MIAELRSYLWRACRLARAEIAALTALLVLTGGVLAFVELADVMAEEDGRRFDRAILNMLRPFTEDPGRPWGPWWLHEAAADITSLGGIAVLGLFALVAMGFLIMMGKRLSAVLLVAGLAGGVVLSEGLKAVFERERPPAPFQVVETLNASFPSGHALLATVFYLTLGVMLTQAFPRRRFKAYALGVGVILALMVGVTRVYLGAHWATDVIAGWCVGAAWAMALWLTAYAVQRLAARRLAKGSNLRDD